MEKPSPNAAQPYAKAEGSVSSGTGLPGLSGTKAVKWLLLFFQELCAFSRIFETFKLKKIQSPIETLTIKN